MDIFDLTMILINVFLVMAIICMYVKLTSMNKKLESFTPAQRWTWARKYRTAPNYLMPSNKQPTEKLPYMNEMTSNRGDRSMRYMLPKSQRSQVKGYPNEQTNAQTNAPVAPVADTQPVETTNDVINPAFQKEMIKNGSNALDTVVYDDSKSVPDTSFLPVETQTGVIDNNSAEQFSTNNRANPGFLRSSTTGFFQHNKDNKVRTMDGIIKRKRN